MFYSHTILARKGPLGTVWIAAHFEKKLKKPQIDKINVASYADFIIDPHAPLALRLSGHLLFGLVKIYELKVHYTLKDSEKLASEIRSSIASLKIDLPCNADKAPFESVTLPSTFQLDEVNLGDLEFNIDGDNNRYQKNYDEITLTDFISDNHATYESFTIIENDNSNSNQHEFSNQGLAPIDEETLPPYNDEMIERISPVKNSNENPLNEDQIEIEIQDLNYQNENDNFNLSPNQNSFHGNLEVEQFRAEASSEGKNNLPQSPPVFSKSPPVNVHDSNSRRNQLQISSEDVLIPNKSPRNKSPITPPSSGHQQDIFTENHETHASVPIVENDIPLQNRTPPLNVPRQENRRRKKKQVYDESIVLSNKEMQKQLNDTSKLVSKRRKLPDNSLATWRLHVHRLKDQVAFQPLITGMCTSLIETMERTLNKITAQAGPTTPEDATPGSVEYLRANSSSSNKRPREISPLPNSPPPNINFDNFQRIEMEFSPIDFPTNISNDNIIIDNNNINNDFPTNISNDNIIIDNNNINNDFLETTPANVRSKRPRVEEEAHESGQNSFYDMNINTASPPHNSPNINNDNNNNNNNNEKLDFLETPMNVKSKRSRVVEDADKRGENLSFVDIEREEENSWSARSMGLARFLREYKPTKLNFDDEPENNINLNEILENRSRKECARMFFETLVLTNCDFIGLKQDKPYGDILIRPKPKLSSPTKTN